MNIVNGCLGEIESDFAKHWFDMEITFFTASDTAIKELKMVVFRNLSAIIKQVVLTSDNSIPVLMFVNGNGCK